MRIAQIAVLLVGSRCFGQTITATPPTVVRAFPSNATTASTDSVRITASGPITVAAVTQSGGNWLSVSPLTATQTADLTVGIDPSGLPDGTYLATVNVGQAAAAAAISIVMMIGNPGPQLDSSALVNAAGYQGGAVSPGEIVTLFGAGIGPPIPYGARVQDGALVAKLAATRVWFDNVPAPLIYAYRDQVAAVVPFEVTGKASVRVQVENLVARSIPFSIPVQSATPGLFTADSSGKGRLAALNQDFSYNSPTNPAAQRSIVVMYATGAGLLTPQLPSGTVASTAPFPSFVLPVQVSIGGKAAELIYNGQFPGAVAGAMQLNVRVPDGIASGEAPVVLTVGTAQSQPGVTIWVR